MLLVFLTPIQHQGTTYAIIQLHQSLQYRSTAASQLSRRAVAPLGSQTQNIIASQIDDNCGESQGGTVFYLLLVLFSFNEPLLSCVSRLEQTQLLRPEKRRARGVYSRGCSKP